MQELREFEDQGNSLDPVLFDFCIWITFLLLRPALLGALHIEWDMVAISFRVTMKQMLQTQHFSRRKRKPK